jgi:DNA-cytosine methyltransferase
VIVGSLFSGAGLLDIGLHQAGIRHGWFVERDEWRCGLLEQRFPGVPVHDDIRTVGADNLARVDGVVGGFPCKGASSAGKRTGLAHPETALWSEFERVVRELRPRYVLVENVAAILSLHDGAVWGTVLGDLAALGYDVAWDCVPASAVGAPHGRDRVFAVAHAQDGRWAAAADAGEPGGLGRHVGAAVGAAADPDGARRPAGWQPKRPECDWVGDVVDEDVAEAAADAERRVHGRTGRADVPSAARAGEAEAPQRERLRSDAANGDRGICVEWGDYQPAITRWEHVHGPAPEPLIRRVDDGDPELQRMRARVDRSRLSALGDGVHVYVGRIVGEALMELWRADQEEEAA